jgi:hypothetical protein
MDSGWISGAVTAVLLTAFLGGSFWLFAVRRAGDFERMARMALDEETPEETP